MQCSIICDWKCEFNISNIKRRMVRKGDSRQDSKMQHLKWNPLQLQCNAVAVAHCTVKWNQKRVQCSAMQLDDAQWSNAIQCNGRWEFNWFVISRPLLCHRWEWPQYMRWWERTNVRYSALNCGQFYFGMIQIPQSTPTCKQLQNINVLNWEQFLKLTSESFPSL